MDKALIIFKKELRDMFRDKRVRMTAVITPVIMMFIFMYLFGFLEQTVARLRPGAVAKGCCGARSPR